MACVRNYTSNGAVFRPFNSLVNSRLSGFPISFLLLHGMCQELYFQWSGRECGRGIYWRLSNVSPKVKVTVTVHACQAHKKGYGLHDKNATKIYKPVARNLRVTASLSAGEIACLITVS